MYVINQKDCSELVRDLNKVLDEGGADVLSRLAAKLRERATTSLVLGVIQMGLQATTESLAEGVFFRDGCVTLANNSRFALDLRYTFSDEGAAMAPAGERSRLLARSSDVIIANIGPRVLEGVRYEIDREVCFDEFDTSASLVEAGRFKLGSGDCLIVRGGRDVASLGDVTDVRFLSLMRAPGWSLDWVFDRESLRPIARSVAHVDDSQLVTCLEVATWLQSEHLHPAVRALLDHPAHFVRWKAVQALGALGQVEVEDILRRASTRDRHPDIRKAAYSTLARLTLPDSA